jgi:hypothetical protein
LTQGVSPTTTALRFKHYKHITADRESAFRTVLVLRLISETSQQLRNGSSLTETVVRMVHCDLHRSLAREAEDLFGIETKTSLACVSRKGQKRDSKIPLANNYK